MAISVFELFTIGLGPSSSHTVGPMRAANLFLNALEEGCYFDRLTRIQVTLFGSLSATGKGHGTDKAVLGGLAGFHPETADPDELQQCFEHVLESGTLALRKFHKGKIAETREVGQGAAGIAFNAKKDMVFSRSTLKFHSNALRFEAFAGSECLIQRTYYSVGGGFVIKENAEGEPSLLADSTKVEFAFASGKELLEHCVKEGLSISTIMRHNERAWRTDDEMDAGLLAIWEAMKSCVQKGCETEGILPGGLKVRRRAAPLYRKLCHDPVAEQPLGSMDWVNLWALAVNEENAAGGRVVTAPTNGAAGIIPAVLHYFEKYCPGANEKGVIRFLLTAAAIGTLFKMNASISGAEVGCQGEVGSACSMAAAGLAEVLGGTPQQVENAAEIGMEHNLGLTCDPIGGLVQVPCIERNAMAAVKAINAARLALRGDGQHHVSLDKVIATMRQTGRDMKTKYKETARGGLAVNVIEC
jgi:L-serine dehydratase